MKRRFRRIAIPLAILALAGAAGAAFWIWYVVPRRVDRAIAEARRSGGAARVLHVTREQPRSLGEAARAGVTALTSTSDWRDGASAFGKTWAATSGGVVVLRPDGAWERTLTWADGLGTADTTCVVRHGAGLAVGGADGSLTLVDDSQTQVVRFDAGTAVTDLVSDGELLYAALAGAGLVMWDGRKAALLETAGGARLGEITALTLGGPGLAVGTASGGVLVRREGRLVPLALEGNDRITALAWDGDRLWVGTPFALTRVDPDGTARPVRRDLFVTSILVDRSAQRVYVGTFDSGVLLLDGAAGSERSLGGRQRIERVRMIDGAPVAFGPGGAWQVAGGGFTPLAHDLPPTLAGAHVTALAARGGEIWVGTFENGIDVLDLRGAPLRHLPSTRGYGADQVNAIEPRNGDVLVTTVRGVLLEHDGGGETRIGRDDGLIGDQVQDAAAHGASVAYATNAGVTVMGSDGVARSVYALQGLANNHCYAVAWGGDGRLYVGTLGGVSVLGPDLIVERSYGAAKHELRAAWVTALAAAPEAIYAGTYGGGVARLASGGEVQDLGPRGEIRVNPGALLLDGDRLYVGTLEDGLLVYDRAQRTWRKGKLPLGSPSVTALAATPGALWIGTDKGLVRVEQQVIDAALEPVPQS